MLLQALCIISYPLVNSNWSYSPETPNLSQIRRFLQPCDLEIWRKTIGHVCYLKLCALFHTHWWILIWYSPETLNSGQNRQFFLAVWPRNFTDDPQQGKSEGFESCDRPIVRKRPIWVKIGDVLSRVTLKFDGWPLKTTGHLSFAVSSLVQHFIAISEFKLELLSGNAQFGSNSTICRAVWPWNLTYDLEKQ